jgi:hypothetical protein
MPRSPNPVKGTDVIARPNYIIRSITDLDIHNESIRYRCHCPKHCQKYFNFQFHISNSIS